MTMRYKPPQVPPPGAPAGPPRYKAWQGFEPEVPEFVPDPMQVAGGGMMPLGPSAVRTPADMMPRPVDQLPVITDQFNPRPPPFSGLNWPTFGPLFEQPEQYDLQYQYGFDPAAYSGYGPV